MRPFDDVSDEPLLNIKAVSQATGIDSVTLRAWERRYGVPDPGRNESGYRLYSERDIAILDWLKEKVDAGVNIKRAVAMLHSHVPQNTNRPMAQSGIFASSANYEETRQHLMDAAHHFDSIRAQQVITQSFALFSFEDVCIHILIPSLRDIGTQWRTGDASLQVEHFLTNIIRQQLLAIGATMPPPNRQGRLMAGCAPGDWHEMPVLMMSLFIQRRGWEVIYLGQAVGLDQLEQTLKAVAPGVVLLSASSFITLGNLVRAAVLVQEVQGENTVFTYGGTVFDSLPGITERVPGLFMGRDMMRAVQMIDDLLSGSHRPVHGGHYEPSTELKNAYQQIQDNLFHIKNGLTEILLSVKPDLQPEPAMDDAAQLAAAVQTALWFEMPGVYEHGGTSPAVDILGAYEVSLSMVIAAFEPHLDLDAIQTLSRLFGDVM